ncbi:MAG: OsmC family protein [Spirochaetales bacterium]|jgi:putative redox protein|nr:OsmC family protein [Exilispira sp.]NMC67528.1 OsmC family protein [Spirochaetales bacterium]
MYSKAKWNENLSFTAELDGHTIELDTSIENGGKNLGPRPKGLMLTALLGCTGMDVASLMKKMKITVESFSLDCTTETTDEHPKVFKDIILNYYFTGDIEDRVSDIIKAIKLSQEKYCGVSAMLKKNSKIIVKLFINNKEIEYPYNI